MEQNTSDNLKDLNEIKAFIAPCFFSYGMVGDVKSIPKNELEDLENDYGYEGKDYKSIFKKEVYINFSCYERVYFSNCEFKSKVSLHIIDNDNTVCFLNGMDFSNCIFEDEINFKRFISGTSLPENKYYNNEQDTLFKNCIFKKRVVFHNSNFFNSIYFNNSHFKDYVDFHECRFEKTTCFYGVTFDKGPNFSQVIFKENLNAVNANLNFTFNGLKIQIKKEEENFNKDKNEQYQKSLDKFANDFRDSFRVFKNALIKDNNLLEASKFHKYELYCKEIELEEKKPKKFSKEWIDKWQLFFYRKLCDHHTDILQSLNSLILVIGIFGVLNLAIIIGFNRYLDYKLILEHLYFSLDFYNLHIKPFIENNYSFIMFVNFIILFVYLILVGFVLCAKYIREFFITISYVITFFIMVTSPKILIPAMGIFTDKRVMLDPLSVLGGIYTIVFGFVVYSFVKTIRKNSIVPS
ncbi:TPA: pentapeptide repeat-containing protein [Campylobacter lari]|nr:pentapeptide repeat-containing protein [Campylobacter lari]HEG2582315.1 pentapeptide repeat-containing protein [Campylobacter lari]